MEYLGCILFGQGFIEKKKLEASVSGVSREEGKMEVSAFRKERVTRAQAGVERRRCGVPLPDEEFSPQTPGPKANERPAWEQQAQSGVGVLQDT